jgi:hypothetical protein
MVKKKRESKQKWLNLNKEFIMFPRAKTSVPCEHSGWQPAFSANNVLREKGENLLKRKFIL